MLKRINELLNIIIGSAVGVSVGHGMYVYGHHMKYPELYAMQSAPWYTSVLLYSGFALATVTVSFILKMVLRKRMQQESRNLKE